MTELPAINRSASPITQGQEKFRRLAGAALVVMGLIYAAWGGMRLFQTEASDMQHRVLGLTLIGQRDNPYRSTWAVAPEPPWAWGYNLVIYGIPRVARKPVYLLLMLASVAWMARWAWREGSRVRGASGGWLAAGAALAMSSICTCIGLGQNAFFITVALLGALACDGKAWGIASGLLLGMALGKPNIALFFGMVFLMKRRWVTLGVALAYVMVAWGLTAWLVRTSPMTLLHDWQAYVESMAFPGYSMVQVTSRMGISQPAAIKALVVLGGLGTTALCWVFRKREILVLAAVAATLGRLFSYHQLYDNQMMVFLLLPLVLAYLRKPGAIILAAMFSTGLLLWVPGKANDLAAVQFLQSAVWLGSLGVLLFADGRWRAAGGSLPTVAKVRATA
jgi:hypothetical protein